MTQERILVTIGRKRVPIKRILHGRELREAMAEFELFRQQFNEQEFLLGGRVYLQWSDGECWAECRRPETDREYAARQQWLAEQAALKAERKRVRELRAHERALKAQAAEAAQAEQRARDELAMAREIAHKYGLTIG